MEESRLEARAREGSHINFLKELFSVKWPWHWLGDMSVLQVLPRLASWGNLHKRRTGQDELEAEYTRITNDIEAMEGKGLGNRNRRRKISYWSDDEDRSVTNERL